MKKKKKKAYESLTNTTQKTIAYNNIEPSILNKGKIKYKVYMTLNVLLFLSAVVCMLMLALNADNFIINSTFTKIGMIISFLIIFIYIKLSNPCFAVFQKDKDRKKYNNKILLVFLINILFSSGILISMRYYTYEGTYSILFIICWLTVSASMIYIIFLCLRKYQILGIAEKILIIFVSICFSLGFIEQSNIIFDYSKPVKYTAVVVDKHISSAGPRTRSKLYLIVAPFGPYTVKKKIPVLSDDYYNSNDGDKITITNHNGLLKTYWFTAEIPMKNNDDDDNN